MVQYIDVKHIEKRNTNYTMALKCCCCFFMSFSFAIRTKRWAPVFNCCLFAHSIIYFFCCISFQKANFSVDTPLLWAFEVHNIQTLSLNERFCYSFYLYASLVCMKCKIFSFSSFYNEFLVSHFFFHFIFGLMCYALYTQVISYLLNLYMNR